VEEMRRRNRCDQPGTEALGPPRWIYGMGSGRFARHGIASPLTVRVRGRYSPFRAARQWRNSRTREDAPRATWWCEVVESRDAADRADLIAAACGTDAPDRGGARRPIPTGASRIVLP
jgi:hypothetical protein